MFKSLPLKIMGWCCFTGFALGCSDKNVTPMLRPFPDQGVENVVQQTPNTQEIYLPRIHILFVIDDSGSMAVHQKNLRDNTAQFVSALEQGLNLHYSIGVTTTSERDQGLLKGPAGSHKYITLKTPDRLRVLADSMMVGVRGEATEQLLSQIIPVIKNTSLQLNNSNSYFAVVFVTDAEDQSELYPKKVYSELVHIMGGESERLLAYGVIVPPGIKDCPRDHTQEPHRIIEFINLVSVGEAKGKYFNLCSPDFGNKLAGIAEDIVEKVNNQVYLNKVPDPKTIRVMYGEINIPNHPDKGWTYDPKNKSIYLGKEMEWPNDSIERELTVSFERAIFPEERKHAQ